MSENKPLRARAFEIVQYEINPKTGVPLFSEQNIINGLQFQTIERWAYILHDEDEYDEADENRWYKRLAEAGENPETWLYPVRAGDKKPRHWHIVVYCQKAVEITKIAEWFGVPENQVEILKGHGAFWSRIEYITHEHPNQQAKGKHRYEDSRVIANVDWRAELNARAERRIRYGGKNLKAAERLQYEVMYNGLTLREAREKDSVSYMRCLDKLKKMRRDYLSNCPPPRTRINYYVDGPGGIGKGLLCRALARSLCPDLTEDDEIYFNAGAKGVAFEGYDGQRVIIWNDRRAIDLLTELNGRDNVFSVFDTHPEKKKQHIKYDSLVLSHEVNIINGIQSYDEFLDALTARYKIGKEVYDEEDKSQSYRRFPFIIRIHEEDFNILINRGFAEDTRNYEEYIEYQSMRMNWQRLQVECGRRIDLAREIEKRAVAPIISKHKEMLEKFDVEPEDEAAILAKYADIGVMQNVVIRRADGSTAPYTPPPPKQEEDLEAELGVLFPKMLFTARRAVA